MNQTGPIRRRGRPPADDDANPRERLLDAAERLFAERGFEGTPLRAVAEAAGVNPALVSYYFGGKRGLLEAVFEQALEPMASALQDLMDDPRAPPTAGTWWTQSPGAFASSMKL